jgi:hypothetical protein
MRNLTGRFLQNSGILEKLYGLDMAANNDINDFSKEINTLAKDKNESIARRAKRTAEKLGIELSDG